MWLAGYPEADNASVRHSLAPQYYPEKFTVLMTHPVGTEQPAPAMAGALW